MATPPRLAYGYLRVLPGMGIQDVLRVQRDLVVFAEENGLVLADVFVEAKWQQLKAWQEVVTHCHTKNVANVVMPSPQHLHQIPVLAGIMRDEVEREIGGTLWLVEPLGQNAPAGQEAGRDR
ncbi:hypothetical protein [Streptomyces dysideae]|uniref:Resolvase/invertase-type recombinase catalytic domain-containing protein n=1 Tax=Streptomyces dysideae TaxID=909626 RepID=A0A117S073_9ACTN|nr:hypothetical protein [Streptomyces dysideae]KUO18814.1 hypothetical protein AQJ91_23415 [Streptomyces dysideae]